MYHHRHQPPPPKDLANKTAVAAAAFASHNYPTTTSNNSHNSSSTPAPQQPQLPPPPITPTNINTTKSGPFISSRNNHHHHLPNLNSSNNHYHHRHNFNYNHNHNHHQNNYNSPYASNSNRNVEDRQDVIFRKVRGILNKITPETFDKLSKELVNVGLDSPRTLRGVIYLLFDKALKDLKYSSLYAKLCQELSEKAPNFEVELGPNTFCKFLISKCEDEFQRRRKATEDFDRKNDLTDEEYEQRAIAKQKMLGNIKFICELGKKRLLQEEILHECIRGLLSKKKERSIQDQAQDLECLSQIMRTIGSLLDIQASRNLMNQYFERIDMFSKKPELPSRIRFMLRDVIDLRNNNWRPRPFQREDNVPQPLSKLREEAGYDPTISSSNDKFGNNRNLIGISDLSKLHGNKLSLLLDDEPSFTTTTDFHWGPSFMPLDHPFDPFSMGTSSNKPVQKSNTYIAADTPPSNAQFGTKTAQKPTTFRAHDPFPEQMIDRGIDARPSFTRSNMVDQQRSIEVTNAELRQCSDVSNLRGEAETYPRSRQQGFMPHNAPKVQRDDVDVYHDARRPIEPRPTLPSARDQLMPQSNNRLITRRQDPRDFGSMPHQDGHRDVHSAQSRNDNRHLDARNPSVPLNAGPESRDRRPFHQDNHQEQNPRFPNNFRSARPERGFRGRENYRFERSNNESETNQNWRVGPPSSSSKVEMRHNNPPPSIDSHPDRGYNLRNTQPDVQERQRPERLTDPRLHNDLSGTKPVHLPTLQPRVFAKDLSTVVDSQREYMDSIPRGHVNRDNQIPQKIFDPRDNQIDQSIPRYPEIPLPTPFERRLNISPPRSRNLDMGPRHQVPTQQNSIQPPHQHTRQNPQHIRGNPPESSEPFNISQLNPHRRVIAPPHSEFAKNLSTENAKSVDAGTTIIDKRFKPLSRSNNPSVSSDIQDPDRVSSWRKGSFTPAPQQPVKTPTKETVKPSLNATILPKTLPKLGDTNLSLRPSHNLISARASAATMKLSNTAGDNAPPSDTVPQVKAIHSKGSAGDQSNLHDGAPAVERPATNGSASDKETHNNSARDFHVNKFISVLSEHSDEQNCNINRTASKVKELKIPKSYQPNCLVSVIKQSIFKAENDRESARKLIAQLLPNTFEAAALLNAFKIIFEQLQALEAELPKVKSLVAGFLSQSILDGQLSLEEVGGVLSGGRHHPLFLLCLQKLENNAGQAWLNEKFIKSKIDLMMMLPEVDRSKDRLASILKDRCLGFLDPMLTIEPDLWDQMKDKDSSPTVIYRWIKDNISSTIQSTPTFAHVLVTCLVRYIHNTSTERIKASESSADRGDDVSNSNESSPSSTSQRTAEIEKELLSKYQQMLQAILKGKQMQLATLYSLQSFYHSLDFPKGALLRWFHQMYDLNIVDDDVFFIWKEEINDEFPGKGQALFQVNTWLNWLAEAEAESEDEEEG